MLTAEQVANRRRWIKALRSGEYRQGHGMLRDYQGQFCCLGVACEVTDLPYCHTSGFPPHPRFKLLFGLDDTEEGLLAEANDGHVETPQGTELPRFTFGEIADTLELLTLADQED